MFALAKNKNLNSGGIVMFIGALSFIVYGIAFFFRAFTGKGFELGVETIGGATPAQLTAFNAALVPYITHLHIAIAAFIIATGIAVGALSLYAVRRGEWWAWIAAVIAPVVGLAMALPMHYFNLFAYNQATHLGPIYVGTAIFVVGALIALKGLLE